MSLTYQDFWSEIKQTFPNLSPFLAQRFVQRSVIDIYTSHQWSFLQEEGVLFSPAIITTGTFSITQFSNQITANAAAITALTGLVNPLITKRQIRFGVQIYNILSFDSGTGIIELDRPVVDSTNAAATYRLYRCYYGPPMQGINGVEVTDFMRYNTIYNPAISSYFRDVQAPRDILNQKDPQRNVVGNNPYFLFTYKGSSDGTPQFEMWPHPFSAQAYLCSYQRRGIQLTNATDTLPLVIPDDLVIQRASYYGCLWAMKNQSRYPELKGVNWMLAAKEHDREYSNISAQSPGILEITQRQDEEVFPQSLIIDDRTYNNFAIGDDDKTGFFSITP